MTSETQRKSMMRGEPASSGEVAVSSVDEMPRENDSPLFAEDDEEEPKIEERKPEIPSLPEFVEETDEGEWLYSIQHPFEKPPGKEKFPIPKKIRIPKTIYARHIRAASKGDSEGEAIFYLACSLCNFPEALMERMDARDYGVVQALVLRRSRGN